jgi:hypothetical protein
MPGTGPLRRSSAPARKKAIVGKSRVEPELLQSPAFVFLLLVNGLRFQAAAFNARSSVFALEVLLTPIRRHVDTVLHLVAAPPRRVLRASPFPFHNSSHKPYWTAQSRIRRSEISARDGL